jgi:hypothetical protein
MSKFLITIGLMAMLAFSLVLFIAVSSAYFSPTKSVNIRINSVGEADIEMILLSLLLPVSILSSFFVMKRISDKEKESYILHTIEKKALKQL